MVFILTFRVIAGGDYQEGGDPENSANNVNNIIAQVKAAGYDTMDGFIFIGDYDCEPWVSSTDNSKPCGMDNLSARFFLTNQYYALYSIV